MSFLIILTLQPPPSLWVIHTQDKLYMHRRINKMSTPNPTCTIILHIRQSTKSPHITLQNNASSVAISSTLISPSAAADRAPVDRFASGL